MSKGLKQWKCPNGHVLGVVERVKAGQEHVTRLMLFRQALDIGEKEGELMQDVDVIANIEGTILDVRCSVPGCGQIRSWFAGEDALARMVERVQAARSAARIMGA
jgi:hypothetical protein